MVSLSGKEKTIYVRRMFANISDTYDRLNNILSFGFDQHWRRVTARSCAPVDGGKILDVATGTGRLPLALLRRPDFEGRVVGLDLARRMLAQAAPKLTPHQSRCLLVHQDAARLPFAADTFDAVTCLETLEFLARPQAVLLEMARVLRPGGLLLTTNRINWEARLMPGKAFSREELTGMLRACGLDGIRFQRWQVYYDLVWAVKPVSGHHKEHWQKGRE